LDTGIDLQHEDFRYSRLLRFEDGRPKGEDPGREQIQMDRIKGRRNFCSSGPEYENNVQDLDGHGTQVAGIILRLAPRAELYIARVCRGGREGGGGEEPVNPLPNIVANVSSSMAFPNHVALFIIG
jgi:hypothetical protein